MLVAAGTHVLLAVADAVGSGFDPLTLLASTGIPGVVIILLITGKLRTESEVKRLEGENDRKDIVIAQKDEQIQRLQAGIVDQAIPVLTRSTELLGRITSAALDQRRHPEGGD